MQTFGESMMTELEDIKLVDNFLDIVVTDLDDAEIDEVFLRSTESGGQDKEERTEFADGEGDFDSRLLAS